MGERNCACVLRSRMIGETPRKVVTEVSMMGRKRTFAPCTIASDMGSPLRCRSLMKSMSTSESFTTTPDRPTSPNMESMPRSSPMIR